MSAVDYAAGTIGWPLFLLGLVLIAGGVFGLAWIFRYELGYDEPEIPPVVDPDRTAIISAVRPEPNYHRDDTHVIPGIPGALPPRTGGTYTGPPLVLDESGCALVPPRPFDHLARRPYVALQGETIPGLRVIPSAELWPAAGPVCPTCGGPFGACACYSQKSAPMDSEETQVVDLCPLTTQDIVVPSEGEAPFHDAMARESNQSTRDLSGSLARAKECAA